LLWFILWLNENIYQKYILKSPLLNIFFYILKIINVHFILRQFEYMWENVRWSYPAEKLYTVVKYILGHLIYREERNILYKKWNLCYNRNHMSDSHTIISKNLFKWHL
jgi:hypothetical protein